MVRPWRFSTYTDDLGEYPTAAAMGTPSPHVKAMPGNTITPVWPDDVVAGKIVTVIVGHVSPGSATAPAGQTWHTGVFGGVAASLRWDSFERVCDGTEVPGGAIGTFTYPTSGGQAAVATAFTVAGAHPQVWAFGHPSVLTGPGQNPTTGPGVVNSSNLRSIWVSMSTGADVSPPAGWVTMLRTGASGLNTLNLTIGTHVEGLAAGETQKLTTLTGSISPAGGAITAMMSYLVDPR
jgi:hypothetical protein